ncbi:PAS domain S-box protein [Halostella salina]|uniref:PAS domain S-box protein n=1 Tax=Halostella salina TaxID=1547897 RepID=UPI000EF7E9BA|nr:PAS domain S-box protein [Halostella salina]
MGEANVVLAVRPAGDERALVPEDATRRVATSLGEVFEALGDGSVDCVVTESDLDGLDGLDVVAAVREHDPDVPVLLVADEADGHEAADATRLDVTEYVARDALAASESVADRVAAAMDGEPPGPSLDSIRAVAESISDAVVTVDADSTIVFANEALSDLTGYETEALVGQPLTKLIPERLRESHREGVARYLDTGERQLDWNYIELPVELADGTERPVAVSFGEFTRDGERFFTGSLRDITERKEREATLNGLLDASGSLIEAESAAAVARIVADAVAEVLGFEPSGVYLLDDASGDLQPAAVTGTAPGFTGPDAPPAADRVAAALATGESRTVEETTGATPESLLVVPLGDHGAVVAGATGDDRDEEAEQLARLLAESATVALDRVDRQTELRRFETVFETVQDMLYVADENGELTHVTPPLADRLGREREELVGSHVSTVIDGEAVETGERIVRSLLGEPDRDSETFETTLLTAEGDPFPVEIELSLLPSEDRFEGTVGSVRDLSALEQARTRLREERSRFEYLFDNIPDAVVEVRFVDGEPVVESVNPAFADVFGYDPTTVIGESINDHILLPDQRSEAVELDRQSERQRVVQREVRRLTADGPRQFLFRGLPYTENGDEVYGFGIYTDITEQQLRQRQLQVLNRVLRHNLRNDLTLVAGYGEEIAARTTDETVAEYAGTLVETVEDLVALSDKAREAEQLVEQEGDGTGVDAVDVVRRVIDTFDRLDGVSIEFDAAGTARVAGDDRIAVAVENLVENAVEHGEGTVRVTVDPDGERVAVRVADDGPGIPEHEQAVVTGDAEITQLQHASGLGLWLVAWIADIYGGHVEFDESARGGAVVSLVLPRLDD